MGSEWAEYSLGDLGRIVTGKTPSKREDGNFGDEVPFVTPRDLDGSRNIETTERYLSEQGASTVKNSIIPPNSIAVSCIGSDMGKAAIVKKRSVTNQQINSIILEGDFDYRYVYYVLSTRKQEIRDAAGGSAQPILNKSHFSQLPILIPPLPEQKAIAHILGTLDDKIELNRRMNATLEGMAQALFKSWFVDFDPVIDNALAAGNPIPDELAPRAEVRKNALANGTTNRETDKLFPNSFQESESIGWIPTGWEINELRDLAEKISKGTTPRKSVMSGASDYPTIPFIKVKDITDGGELKLEGLERIPRSIHENSLKRSILNKGDVLFSIAGTIGRVTIVPESLDDSNANQAIAFIRPNDKSTTLFIMEHLRGKFVQDLIHSRIVQAVQANVSLTVLGDIPTATPPEKLLNYWKEKTDSIYEKLTKTKQANQTLTKLREILLPKLISGELRIPEAKKLTEESLA